MSKITRPCPNLMVSSAMRIGISPLTSTSCMPYLHHSLTIAHFSWPMMMGPRRPRSFRFENFWTNMPGFQQVILEAWNKPSQHHDPFLRLFHKLKKTSQKLRVWSRTLFSNAKVQLHMALEIILRLDEAQDVRILSPEEADLRKRLKRRVVGLAVL